MHLIRTQLANTPTPATKEDPTLCIAVYAAMRSEVNLQSLIEEAYTHTWKICFPCMVREMPESPQRMTFYHVPEQLFAQARTTFLNSPLRCLTPDNLTAAGYQPADPSAIDVAIVPLVAFDDAGHRLGYGGGNYDRFLPKLRDDALVIGAAFKEQRVSEVPVEPHDLPLPHIVQA